MKVGTKQYAIALYELAKGKSMSQVDELVVTFIESLARQGRSKLLMRIFDDLERYIQQKDGTKNIQLTFASKDDEREVRQSFGQFEKLWKGNVVVAVDYDSSLVSGIKATIDSVVIDASLKTQLRKLKERLLV